MAAAIERIFASFKEDRGATSTPGSYDPGDPETYSAYIKAMISDSVDYEGSVLAGERNEAQEYYYGMRPGLNGDGGGMRGSDTTLVEDPTSTYEEILGYDKETANRSTYVSTDVRDAIMLMMPGLIRLFAASENPVFLVPRSPDEIDQAQQATDYVNYVFWNDNSGFLILYGALKDALTVRTGFVKWWTDETKETVRKRFTQITADQVHQLLLQSPGAKVVKMGKPIPSGMPPPPPCRRRPRRPCRRLCRLGCRLRQLRLRLGQRLCRMPRHRAVLPLPYPRRRWVHRVGRLRARWLELRSRRCRWRRRRRRLRRSMR